MLESNAAVAAQVPAYFALILRAFSVIEGIALRVDPSYSIVKVAIQGYNYLTCMLAKLSSPALAEYIGAEEVSKASLICFHLLRLLGCKPCSQAALCAFWIRQSAV